MHVLPKQLKSIKYHIHLKQITDSALKHICISTSTSLSLKETSNKGFSVSHYVQFIIISITDIAKEKMSKQKFLIMTQEDNYTQIKLQYILHKHSPKNYNLIKSGSYKITTMFNIHMKMDMQDLRLNMNFGKQENDHLHYSLRHKHKIT